MCVGVHVCVCVCVSSHIYIIKNQSQNNIGSIIINAFPYCSQISLKFSIYSLLTLLMRPTGGDEGRGKNKKKHA